MNLIFNSIEDHIDHSHLKPSEVNKNHSQAVEAKNNALKSGNYHPKKRMSIIECIETVRGGYSEAIPGIKTMKDAILDRCDLDFESRRSNRRMRRMGDFGDELDIDRYNQGDYETMWARTEIMSVAGDSRPKKTLLIDIGFNYGTSAADMYRHGAAALALADIYESAGYILDIWAVCHAMGCYPGRSDRNREAFVATKIHDSSCPLDVGRVASAVCFPGFFRGLVFQSFLTPSKRADIGLGRSNRNLDLAFCAKNIGVDVSEIEAMQNAQGVDGVVKYIKGKAEVTI